MQKWLPQDILKIKHIYVHCKPCTNFGASTICEGQGVLYQYTQCFAAPVVKRVVNVPICPYKDQSDLPKHLWKVNKIRGVGYCLLETAQHINAK